MSAKLLRKTETTELALILIISGASLLTSFFCSLLEACLFSVTQSQIETMVHKGDSRGKRLQELRNRIDEAIASILVLNTVAHSLGASVAGAMVGKHYGDTAVGVFGGAFTMAVLFFTEIIPKSLGVRFAPTLAPILAFPLKAMMFVLYPVVKVCVIFTRLWGKKGGEGSNTEDDIISLVRIVHKEGGIELQEAQWVSNVLKLNDVRVYDLMTPSPVVARVPGIMQLKTTSINADHWRFSRLPVCSDENADDILGVVHRRKVFDALARDEFELTIADLMDPVDFVKEDMPAHRLLNHFLKKRRHLFCVRDEEDNFTGVVALEDVLECLLGCEIVDETDLHDNMQALAKKRRDALLSRGKSSGS